LCDRGQGQPVCVEHGSSIPVIVPLRGRRRCLSDGAMPDYTILLIDYDPRSIERTTGLLVGAGYRVEVAKNGIDGLEAFKRLSPGLVLVEAMLPKKHGFEVCQEIKQSSDGANVPVVIFTAVYRGRKYRSQAFHLYKCDEYLEKPVPDAKLLEAIGKLLPIESKPKSAPPKPATPPPAPTPEKAPAVAAKKAPEEPAKPPMAPAVAAKKAPEAPAKPPMAPAVAAKKAPEAPAKPPMAPAVATKTAPAPPLSPPKTPEPVKAPAVAAKTAPEAPAKPPRAPEPKEVPAVAAAKAPEAAPTAEAKTPPAPPRAEPAKPAKPRPRRPRRDEPIAQFTEDDIMSTLDAIMPDEPAPDKTAAN